MCNGCKHFFEDMSCNETDCYRQAMMTEYEFEKYYGQDQDGCPYREEVDIRACSTCGKEVDRQYMMFTHDCHGIPFRLVCHDCYERLMSKGYDGQYYTEADECLDEDY